MKKNGNGYSVDYQDAGMNHKGKIEATPPIMRDVMRKMDRDLKDSLSRNIDNFQSHLQFNGYGPEQAYILAARVLNDNLLQILSALLTEAYNPNLKDGLSYMLDGMVNGYAKLQEALKDE